jgi:serine/threonine protein kinase
VKASNAGCATSNSSRYQSIKYLVRFWHGCKGNCLTVLVRGKKVMLLMIMAERIWKILSLNLLSLTAQVADFGLSKETNQNLPPSTIKGTYGYVDPEYISTNSLTYKSDVYSFGVLLFEMIAAKSPSQGLMDYVEMVNGIPCILGFGALQASYIWDSVVCMRPHGKWRDDI